MLELLENPPAPNARLLAAVEAGGVALLVDAKNERAAAWYASFGAMPALDAPPAFVLPPATTRAAINARM